MKNLIAEAEAKAKKAVFRVGVIGCGRMASTIEDEQIARRKERPYRGGLVLPYSHAAGYAVVEETEIVAACDIHSGRLNAFMERWNVPKGYTDYRELIDVEKPDILSITTRPQQHAEHMIYGANHGVKGMYAEKPLHFVQRSVCTLFPQPEGNSRERCCLRGRLRKSDSTAVKGNFLAGRTFSDDEDLSRQLSQWLAERNNQKSQVHGRTPNELLAEERQAFEPFCETSDSYGLLHLRSVSPESVIRTKL